LQTPLLELLADFSPELVSKKATGLLELLKRRPSVRLLVVEEDSTSETSSLDLISAVRERREDLAVILLSSNPTIEHATEAIRRGAEDFVPVPFSEELLRKEVQRILDAADLRDRVENLRHLVTDSYGFDRIVSNTARMRPVFERARAATRSNTPVLILGETGTGKELLARSVHANSARGSHSFVPINCAALPKDLIETELFGHRRGAFSGAHQDYAGLFSAAHRGTLFLDEIGDLSIEAQAKLLRALQDGEIRPVGSLESQIVDARVIAATNKSLTDLREGVLRSDLYFRLSVLVIEIPPLRDRLDDLPLLVSHFLKRIRSRDSTRIVGIDNEALELLNGYTFPGNVRELENMLEGISVTLPPETTTIRGRDIRGWLRRRGVKEAGPTTPSGPLLNLAELEGWAIREAMKHAKGNKTKAAKTLGISRDTLYRKLNELGISEKSSDYRTPLGN
jgi:DNA-binding NtrC family response regulator